MNNVFVIDENWMHLKGELANHWSLLSDSQIEKGKKSFDEMVDEIHNSYGVPPEKAEEELTEFLFEDPVKKELERLKETELM